MFKNIQNNLDIINATNNSATLVLIIIAICVIVLSVTILKNVKTLTECILALCLTAAICFAGILVIETHVVGKANDIVYAKTKEMCYTPINAVKADIIKEELQNLTEYELFSKSLNYYSIAFLTLKKYVYENIKNTKNLKPTEDMNIAYSVLLKNLEQIEQEIMYRHKHCLKNVCPETYYPQDNYRSRYGPLDNFQKLKELKCK